MNRWFLKRFFLLVLAEAVVLSAIAMGFVTKHLSGRSLGIAGLLNMVAFFVVFFLFFRKAQAKAQAEEVSLGAAAPEGLVQLQLIKQLRRKRFRTVLRIFWVPIGVAIVIAGDPKPSLAVQIATYGFIILTVAYLCYRWRAISKSIEQIQVTMKQSEVGETQ